MAEAGRPSGDAQGTVGHVVTQRGRDLGPVDRIAVGEQSAAALTDWRVWWQVDFTEHLHPHSLRGCDPPAPHTPAELRDLRQNGCG